MLALLFTPHLVNPYHSMQYQMLLLNEIYRIAKEQWLCGLVTGVCQWLGNAGVGVTGIPAETNKRKPTQWRALGDAGKHPQSSGNSLQGMFTTVPWAVLICEY